MPTLTSLIAYSFHTFFASLSSHNGAFGTSHNFAGAGISSGKGRLPGLPCNILNSIGFGFLPLTLTTPVKKLAAKKP